MNKEWQKDKTYNTNPHYSPVWRYKVTNEHSLFVWWDINRKVWTAGLEGLSSCVDLGGATNDEEAKALSLILVP